MPLSVVHLNLISVSPVSFPEEASELQF